MRTELALCPTARVWDNPLCVPDGELIPLYEFQPVVGQTLRETIPNEAWRAVLIVNGEPLMQRDWYRPVLSGDVIEWHILSGGGGNTSRTILTIIAIVAIAYFTAGLGVAAGGTWSAGQVAALSIGLNIAAQVLINALIPITPANSGAGNAASAASVYNIALSGNQARLNQPIPVIYGRMRTYPDFAAPPYAYYSNNDQFYCALFCVGQGDYAVETLMIDDTPITNFQSVFYNILPPGTLPTRLKANFVSAIEVAGNKLTAQLPIGGFIVCKAKQAVSYVEWDIVAEQGLGQSDNSGNFSNRTVEYDLDIQYVDDFGVPLGDFINLVHGSVTAKERTPQRFTFHATLLTPGRISARMTRTTPDDPSNLIVDTISWAGMRGQLITPATLCATATHVEIVMKANEQLNGLTQKKFNGIFRRKIRGLASSLGVAGWTLPTESRSISAAVGDILSDTTYGGSRPTAEIDLESLYALDQIFAARQDHLDILFDSKVTLRDALKTVAQTGRSVVFQRMGVHTMARDQYQALPVAAYTTRDILPGSTSIGYALPTPETADAISYEYFDNRAWDWIAILCKSPGVVTPVNIVTLRVNGITGPKQALREGTYLAAVNTYRRKFPKWQTEMKGLLAAYGSAVIFSPALPNWGQPGDVVAWDSANLTAYLSEVPIFTPGAMHFITMEQINGQLSVAIPCIPGPSTNSVVLALSPGFIPTTTDSDVERTKYVFGKQGEHQVIVRLMSVIGKGRTSSGSPIIEMSGVAENNLVHTADNAYLPAGGVIQDPVPTSVIGASATTPDSKPRVNFTSHYEITGTLGTDADMSNSGGSAALWLKGDGTASVKLYGSHSSDVADVPTTTKAYTDQWFSPPPDVGVTSDYEVRVTGTLPTEFDVPTGVRLPVGYTTGSALGAWTNLAGDSYWRWSVTNATTPFSPFRGAPNTTTTYVMVFRVEIRKVGGTTNLVDKQFTVEMNSYFHDNTGAGV